MHFALILVGFHRLLGESRTRLTLDTVPVLPPLIDEREPAKKIFMWTRFYVLFSVNKIIVCELVPFEKWYQEAIYL